MVVLIQDSVLFECRPRGEEATMLECIVCSTHAQNSICMCIGNWLLKYDREFSQMATLVSTYDESDRRLIFKAGSVIGSSVENKKRRRPDNLAILGPWIKLLNLWISSSQETSELHRRQQDYQQKQVTLTKEDEEEYYNYCSEAMFRIHILELRLNR